jgi:hypothetical protein
MKSKTQSHVFFTAAAILVSFLFTCKPFTGGASDGDYDESGDRITYTDVDYSPDGKSLTIYLDGSTPVRHSRALNYEHAKFGHDLFEVAFISYKGTIARAVWEKGSAAGVNGVERGVNYSVADPTGLSPGYGAAIIFVGKKSDRTLLAVGKLLSVDGGLPGTTTIGPNSRFVTFQVEPLKAGVSDNAYFSSFTTNSKGGGGVDPGRTDVMPVTIGTGAKDFPLFNLAVSAVTNKNVDAEYKFEVASGLNSTYRNGILRGGAMTIHFPSLPEYRIPRYPMGDGTVEKWGTSKNGNVNNRIEVDGDTGVQPLNNINSSTDFDNPSEFRIGPTHVNHNSEAFAFSFQIPVYPLTNIDSRGIIGPSTPNNFMWYIRPGYDSYWLDLDDGVGNGGAILIGTGEFIESVTTDLIVRKSPNKTRYNNLGDPPPLGHWNLDLTGILLYLNVNNVPIPVPVPSADVVFIIGGTVVQHTDPIETLLALNAGENGIVPVTVEYYGPLGDAVAQPSSPVSPIYIANPSPPPAHILNPDWYTNGGGTPKTASFNLYYYAPSGGLNFSVPPVGNRYIITNQETANNMNTVFSAGGSYLLVFMDSFDLAGPVLNGDNYLIIIIAGKENIVLGKSVAGGAIANNGTTSNYFLGIWPFDEILAVDGEAINSQQFYINAAGSQANVNRTTNPYTILNNGNQLGGTFIGGGGTININYSGLKILDGNLQP